LGWFGRTLKFGTRSSHDALENCSFEDGVILSGTGKLGSFLLDD
jgi:hypothetical protein